jgi:hypothetical protein
MNTETTKDLEKDNKPEEPGKSFVEISIDGKTKSIHRGNRPVSEIRNLGEVPQEFEIDQLINNQYKPLDDNDSVTIKGDEVFVRMPRSGGFS